MTIRAGIAGTATGTAAPVRRYMSTRNQIRNPQVVRTVLSLGSNLGDRLHILRQAVAQLRAIPGMKIRAVSPLYDTVPFFGEGTGPQQEHYLNAVVVGMTTLSAHELLAHTLTIEAGAGRVRRQRWGPRTLDIDIIVHGEDHFTDQVLTLPHPRVAERAFVLVPWAQVEPRAVIPRVGPVAALLRRMSERDRDGVRLWTPPEGQSWP